MALRKWLVLILVTLGLLLVGCGLVTQSGHVQNEAAFDFSRGRQALASRDYPRAETGFARTLSVDPHAERAKRYLIGTQALVAGDQEMNQQRLVRAGTDLRRSRKCHLPELRSEIRSRLAKIRTVKNNQRELRKIFTVAVKLNHDAKYRRSNRVLNSAVANPRYRISFFRHIMDQLKDLRSANDRLLRLNRHRS